jgi:hypothetical protein
LKRRTKQTIISLVAFMLLLPIMGANSNKTEAAYSDNYNKLYYDLSRLVYSAEYLSTYDIEQELNNLHGKDKFEVISAVDVSNYPYHPMSTSATTGEWLRLDTTGFKAMAVVAKDSRKLWIAFSGTDVGWNLNPTISDAVTAKETLTSNAPGQNYQAQLFTNYIYEAFDYKNFNWYFTGHSLGGWLASKTYLDIRAANWLIDTKTKYKFGGGIGKTPISGVYTFNPLPIHKNQISTTQWNANKNGYYNSDVKNLYIDNEWLNGVYDMNTNELDYIGIQGKITNEDVLSHRYLNYTSKGASIDLVDYFRQALTAQKDIIYAHKLSRIKPYVGY